jgi:hypothetical protein
MGLALDIDIQGARALAAPASTQAAPTKPVEKAATTSKRTVNGGGGYVYEQHVDGKIFIVESPKGGKTRIEVKDRKGFDAILAEIGPFPQTTSGTTSSSTSASGPNGASSSSQPPTETTAPRRPAPKSAPAETQKILGGAETETEKKLAEFTKAMGNIVVEVDGQQVSVRPPYHINRGDRQTEALKNREGNAKVNAVIKKVFTGLAGKGATTGKATPEQMQKFLQESVDQKLVKDTTAKGLRDFLDKYGISTDCSGLAVQALNFLADGDMVRGANEGLDASNLGTGSLADTSEKSKFKKVSAPSDLQAGDMMVMGGSHVRLITDVDVQDDGVYFTTLESTAGNVSESGDGVGERRWQFPNASKFSELMLQAKNGEFAKASSSDAKYIYTRRK